LRPMPIDRSVKAVLRAAMLAHRHQAHAEIGAEAGALIARQFFGVPLWQPGQCVAGYLPIGAEADPQPLMKALARRGAALVLPVVTDRDSPLLFRAWQPGARLAAGPKGTSHPTDEAALAIPDLLLVPLVAFDRFGGRLGYGAGYYDRTLAALRRTRPIVAVGVGYRAQWHDRLPSEPHDQRLDWIVTECEVVEVKA
jgi:5-formyltetrahydrofolate cyclo-ligase